MSAPTTGILFRSRFNGRCNLSCHRDLLLLVGTWGDLKFHNDAAVERMRQTLKGIGALTDGQAGRDVWVSYSADRLLRAVARGETEGVTTTRERKISSVVGYSK